MRARSDAFLSFAAAVALVVAACRSTRERPKITPSGASAAPGVAAVAVASSTGSTGSSTATSSSASGAGGAGPSPEVLHTLTCADHETHVVDCEACRASQTQGTCTAEWQTCLGDNYCSSPFFDCVTACKPGDVVCEDACFVKQPASEGAISSFVGCVCSACASFCS